MPSLKDLTCSVELSDGHKPLQELGTVYSDGSVSTFIPVPKNKAKAFTVHLTSSKFIAPGLALFVFIDDVYQCNRNRQDLKLITPPSRRSLVDFRVRQKEERLKDGSMVAREWNFEGLCKDFTSDTPDFRSPDDRDSVGCIEVVVLRCAGPRSAKTPSNMNLDGTSELPDHHFSVDSRSRVTSRKSTYDDRDPFTIEHAPSHYPAYSETVHFSGNRPVRSRRGAIRDSSPLGSERRSSRRHSRHSVSISPRKRHSSIPAPGFQYGSGPIPARSVGESERDIIENLTPDRAAVVDSAWLDRLVTEAVKRGVEQSRKSDVSVDKTRGAQHKTDVESVSQPPGAWPMSPSGAAKGTDDDEAWDTKSKDEWDTKSRDEWDSKSRVTTWDAPDDVPSDSWDTDETWSKKPHWDSTTRKAGSATSSLWSQFEAKPKSRTSTRQRTEDDRPRSHRARSKSRGRTTTWADGLHSSSPEDNENEGWTYIPSPKRRSSPTSTLHPSHSQSQAPRRRARSRSRSQRPLTTQTHSRPRSPSTRAYPHAWTAAAASASHPAVSIATPMNTPSEAISRRKQTQIHPPPAPSWGCAVPASVATKVDVPPAPYGTTLDEFVRSTVGAPADEARWGGEAKAWGSGEKANDDWTTDSGEDSWVEHSLKDRADGWGNEPRGAKNGSGGWAWDVSPIEGIRVPSVSWDDAPKKEKDRKHKATSRSAVKPVSGPNSAWSFPPHPPPSPAHPTPSPSPSMPAASRYDHALGRPVYLDTLQKPYAVFRFRYRGLGVLRGMFGEVDDGGVGGGKEGKERNARKGRTDEEMKDNLARELTEKWVLGQGV